MLALDEKDVLNFGFVKLVDIMGSDDRVVDSARISTSSTKDVDKKKFIKNLARWSHETPFEKVVFEWHIKCPIFIARQWMRHRIGSFNEKSGRYSVLQSEYWIPESIRIKDGNEIIEQSIDDDEFIRDSFYQLYTVADNVYNDLLRKGCVREQARAVLPVGIYTEFYWTVNLRSLTNFLVLRLDKSAQIEMREYALAILKILLDRVDIEYSVLSIIEYYIKMNCNLSEDVWKIIDKNINVEKCDN